MTQFIGQLTFSETDLASMLQHDFEQLGFRQSQFIAHAPITLACFSMCSHEADQNWTPDPACNTECNTLLREDTESL